MAIKIWGKIVLQKDIKKLNKPNKKEKIQSLKWKKVWWVDKSPPFNSFDWIINDESQDSDWMISVKWENRNIHITENKRWISKIKFSWLRDRND